MAWICPPSALACSIRAVFPRPTTKLPSKMTSVARAEVNFTMEDSKFEETAKRGPTSRPEEHAVVGCGGISVDYLASVAKFPHPDEKIRSTDFKVQGGGNAGNALTAAARLGLRPRIISKVADDPFGKIILDELKADGIDTSFMVVSETGTSPFTYIIVDKEMNTRTCIHSPGSPPMAPEELSVGALNMGLNEASILYLDGRLADTALIVAKEAKQRQIPVLIDAEKKREGLDDLLALADFAVCSSKFPQFWTEAPTLPEALIEMTLRLPQLKFVIATLGASGCVMLEKIVADASNLGIMDANTVYDSLVKEKECKTAREPFVVSSKMGLFRKKSSNGEFVKEITGILRVGTAEAIPPSELVDTTGSGDAFIGAVLYAICTGMPAEKMLNLAATVAGANCRALGARAGLPHHHDPKLIDFL